MEFDAKAYLRDTRDLSPAARGLWMDLLCHMDQAEPRGVLAGPDGQKPTLEYLARLTRTEPGHCRTLLCELYGGGLFSVNENGCPYSRRMDREGKQTESIKSKAIRYQRNPPRQLGDWVDWWNSLVARGLVVGEANRNRPSLELCRAWIRLERDAEARELLEDREMLELRIEEASAFVKRWLSLAGLLVGKNGDGELKSRRLLDGRYAADQRQTGKAGKTPEERTAERLARLHNGRAVRS